MKTSLIFIPGIYHGPWCWEQFIKYFEDRGYHTDAVTLFGGSGGQKRATLNSYLDVVERAAEKAKQDFNGPVILVGHSKGGGLAECFIAKRPSKADGVILMAALPLRRTGRFLLSFVWRHVSDWQTAQEMIALLRVAIMLARSKPVPGDLLRKTALFSSRIPEADAKVYSSLLVQEPIRPSLELATFAFSTSNVDLPVHAIASRGDHVFSPWEQKMLANVYGGQTIVLDNLCHDMMLDPEWKRAAEATLTLVEKIEHQLRGQK